MSDRNLPVIFLITWIFGWISWAFKEHPKAFLIGLIIFLVLAYIFYKFLLKTNFSAIKESIKNVAMNRRGEEVLSSNRLDINDENKIAGLDPQLEEIYKQIKI